MVSGASDCPPFCQFPILCPCTPGGTARPLEDLSVSVSSIVDLTTTLSATGGDPPDISPISGHGLSVPKVNPTVTLSVPGGETPEVSPVSGPHVSVVDVDDSKPAKLSSYTVDPTAAYKNKSNWKSTLYTTAGVVIDVVKESSDVFTPLKSVAGGLSAVLKYYDVRCSYLPFACVLTLQQASDGES